MDWGEVFRSLVFLVTCMSQQRQETSGSSSGTIYRKTTFTWPDSHAIHPQCLPDLCLCCKERSLVNMLCLDTFTSADSEVLHVQNSSKWVEIENNLAPELTRTSGIVHSSLIDYNGSFTQGLWDQHPITSLPSMAWTRDLPSASPLCPSITKPTSCGCAA